jgi:hypothetical protein
MARTGITQEEVFQAAEAIRGEGDTPSIDRVRVRLGDTGSPNTIHKYLKIWKASLPPVRQEVEELEPELLAAIAASIAKKAAAARAKAEKETIEANAQLDSLADNSGLVDVEVEALREQNEALEVARIAAAAEANALKGQIEKLEAQCKADQGAAESARMETAEGRYTITAQTEKLAKLEADLVVALLKLDTEREAAAKALKLESDKAATAVREAAVAVSKMEAETRRADDASELGIKTGVRDLDTINELKKELVESRKEAREAEKSKDKTLHDAFKYQSQFNAEHQRNSELQSERDGLASQVATLKEQLGADAVSRNGNSKK